MGPQAYQIKRVVRALPQATDASHRRAASQRVDSKYQVDSSLECHDEERCAPLSGPSKEAGFPKRREPLLWSRGGSGRQHQIQIVISLQRPFCRMASTAKVAGSSNSSSSACTETQMLNGLRVNRYITVLCSLINNTMSLRGEGVETRPGWLPWGGLRWYQPPTRQPARLSLPTSGSSRPNKSKVSEQ